MVALLLPELNVVVLVEVVLVVVGCCRPVGEVAIGLSGSGRELDVDVDGSRGGGVVRCCFVAGSATMSSVAFVCCPKSCVDFLFSDGCSCVSNSVANNGL